jgi:hypothetical protein
MAERIDKYGILINTRNPNWVKERQYQELIKKRYLIRRAFEIVRFDPMERAVMNILLRALTGKNPITQNVLETAQEVMRASEDQGK